MIEEDINNLKEMLVDFNEYSTDYTKTRCRELEKTIKNTLEEIERLKDLCNKYEEEHKTTFEEWKKAINIIKEVREKIESVQLFGLRSGKTLIATLLNDILKILDKVESDK